MPTPSAETHLVRLRITCLNPPIGHYEGGATEFGLQDKQQALHAGHPQPDGSIAFDVELSVQRDEMTGAMRWRGPYVHGTPVAPFIYLTWARLAPAPSRWIRRMKIPLSTITSQQIEAATSGTHARLEARVDGARSGTVRLLDDEWTTQMG